MSAKVALVTGAARRLGAALATDLARRGYDLWLHHHQSALDAQVLAERLRGVGARVRLVAADLAAPGGAEALAQALREAPPTLVVHSASRWDLDTWGTATAEAWEAGHRLHGWTALVLGRLLASLGRGHLVTVLDARLRDRDAEHFTYAFAKRELAGLTRALALELAPVRVNGLALGLVLKPDDWSPARWKAAAAASPLGRPSTPAQVASALRFLESNPSVTGQIVAVDGGRHLKGDLFGSV